MSPTPLPPAPEPTQVSSVPSCTRLPYKVCRNLYYCHSCTRITIVEFNIWAPESPASCMSCGHQYHKCELGCEMRQIHMEWKCWACESVNSLSITPRDREELRRDEGEINGHVCKCCGYKRDVACRVGWGISWEI